MPVTIQSAYFGDEVSSRNVTDALNSRISSGQREIPVNSGIIPMLQVGGVVTLTKEDEDKIKKDAAAQCNGGADQTCVANRIQDLRRLRLQQKETENVSSNANLVKGRRLTVKLKDDKGQVSEYVIPEGQAFKPDIAAAAVKNETFVETKPKVALDAPSLDVKSILAKLFTGVGWTIFTAVATFGYVVSIMFVYEMFTKLNYTKYFVLTMVAIAALIPYSGFVIVGLAKFIPVYFQKTV